MDEIEKIKVYIKYFWPNKFNFKREVPLKILFPEPKNKGLRHIWKYGHADLLVFKREKLITIFEPGGGQHLKDKKQIKNDRRKFMLCSKNKIFCCQILNNSLENLSKRKQRNLLGKVLWTKEENDKK